MFCTLLFATVSVFCRSFHICVEIIVPSFFFFYIYIYIYKYCRVQMTYLIHPYWWTLEFPVCYCHKQCCNKEPYRWGISHIMCTFFRWETSRRAITGSEDTCIYNSEDYCRIILCPSVMLSIWKKLFPNSRAKDTSVLVLCPFSSKSKVFYLLISRSSLYIREIIPLPVIWKQIKDFQWWCLPFDFIYGILLS